MLRCASWPTGRWSRTAPHRCTSPSRSGSTPEAAPPLGAGRHRHRRLHLPAARGPVPPPPCTTLPTPRSSTMSTSPRIGLVTGATRGIGLETVRQLAAAGVHTLLAGRDRGRAVEAALTLQSQGLPVEAIALDVTDADSIGAAAQQVQQRH